MKSKKCDGESIQSFTSFLETKVLLKNPHIFLQIYTSTFERKGKNTTQYPLHKNVLQKTKHEFFTENTILVFISNSLRQRRILKNFYVSHFLYDFVGQKKHLLLHKRRRNMDSQCSQGFVHRKWVLSTLYQHLPQQALSNLQIF